MRIALLGGTGRIGAEVLGQALAAGHEVHVLARRPESLAPRDGLTVVAGDALDAGAVGEAVGGSDAVVSALGPRGPRSPGLLAGAAGVTVAAMADRGVTRLVAVSAAGAFIAADRDTSALVRLILPRVLARPFADVRRMEAAVRATNLHWTLVRPVRLTNKPLTGTHRVRPDVPPPHARTIGRADVAQFILTVLGNDGWLKSAPALAY
ncbi:MAG: NAD(P)-dependent oxidoreductase [Streptosporangiaceae bacterium]